MSLQNVWVFNGNGGHFPAAVFSSREQAETWIDQHGLSGTLTRYPLDVSVYDWAVSSGAFTPKRPDQASAEFVQRFSSASQEHHHYEGGQRLA